tara:strand:- start:246 stop:605 length:360 start_codon:yes stop_codon:yes gene_type:complete
MFKTIVYCLFPVLFIGCKSDAHLSMERGIRLYDWGKYNEAIVEFNKVRYLLNYNEGTLEDIELLAQAHYNLGITYAKMDLLHQAEQEVLNALSLIPNKEYRDILNLIRDQQNTTKNVVP